MSTAQVIEKVWQEIDELEDDFLETLQKLVRTPSVVGQEAAAQEVMAGLYQQAGLEVIGYVFKTV